MTKRAVGKYRLLKQIGRGGMATVYKAYDTKLERVVALKIPLPEYARDASFVARFLREARIAAKLDHPNIITIFDVGEQRGTPYFTMQYVEQTLQALLERRAPLSLAQALPLINQIASALDYAHDRHIVHRDVKPTNILINRDGQAILADFGIAKAADGLSFTRVGTILGAPGYMSPEQARGSEVDRRSDIYSLGVVCYHMLAGRPPYARSYVAPEDAGASESLPPLSAINPQVPPAVGRVVHKARAKQKKNRYESAGKMAQALELALTGGRTPRPPVGPPRRKVTQPRTPAVSAGNIGAAFSALPKPMLAAVIGLVALVALGLLFTRPQVPPSPGLTPTWTDVPQPAEEVSTKTPTPSPTRTRVPATPTPTQTAVPPTPTTAPTPTCAASVDSQLAGAWDRSRLGCPTAPGDTVWAAWQRFERGYMSWRSDTRRVTVFFDNRTWTEFRDQWLEGASIPSRGSPPPGLLAPTRGFGYIWGIHDSVANGIGWALEEEKGFCAKIQLLEQGLVFRSSTVAFCQDRLYNWATHPSFRPLFFAVYSDGTWEQR